MKKLAIACFLLLAACTEQEEGIQPQIGLLTESVYASAIVEPEEFYQVYPTAAGILDSLLVSEGDTVSQGQIIARIVSQSPEIAKENAQLNLKLAESKYTGSATLLGTIEQEISLAKVQVRQDSINFVRQQNLWDQNIGSQSTYENQKLKYEQSRNRLEVLQQQYEQTQIELRNAYRKSKNALEQAQTNLQDYTIRSRMDGMVYALLREEGEFVSSQSVLARLGREGQFVIKLQVDEVDIAKIGLDQACVISLDAYSGQTFNAKVRKIFPLKNERTQTFLVEATFDDPPSVLYAGLSGEANIILETREDVMSIPVGYLTENGTVLVKGDEVKVETGIRNMERIEILSGIDTTDILFAP